MINEDFILLTVPTHILRHYTHIDKHTHTDKHKHKQACTRTKMDSQEEEYLKGSLVSVLCGNSVGQVMEQGVMMH